MGTCLMGMGVFGNTGGIVFGEVVGILRGGCFSEGSVGETAGETGGHRGSDQSIRPSGITKGQKQKDNLWQLIIRQHMALMVDHCSLFISYSYLHVNLFFSFGGGGHHSFLC